MHRMKTRAIGNRMRQVERPKLVHRSIGGAFAVTDEAKNWGQNEIKNLPHTR